MQAGDAQQSLVNSGPLETAGPVDTGLGKGPAAVATSGQRDAYRLHDLIRTCVVEIAVPRRLLGHQERARIRGEKGIRRGGHPLAVAT